MSSGVAAMQQGDFAAAKRDFSTVVGLAPQVEPGHAALGSALMALGEFEAAVRELEIARKLSPDDFGTALNLGRAQTALGNYQDAVAAFHMGIAAAGPATLSPEEAIAYAKALAATGQLSTAAEILQSGVDAAPDSAMLQDGLGTALAQQGKVAMALPHFERAAAIDSTFAQAQLHAAAALLALDRAADAMSTDREQ